MSDLFDELAPWVEALERRVAEGPVATGVTAGEVRRHLAETFDLERAMALPRVVEEVTAMLERWQVQVTHPRYFGLFNPSTTTASVLADTLVAAFNPQLAAWSHAPAANEIERFTLRALAARIGLDPEATAAHFTSGGAEANLTGVVAALADAFPEWAGAGLRGLPGEPRLYVSGEGHHSVHKAARVTGLGDGAIGRVRTDASGRMNVEDLAAQVTADRRARQHPFLVVATAGTTGSGAVDPLGKVADLCSREGLWLHVDAAWAGAAALSPHLKRYVAGLERADSLTLDAHKWLSVPMGAGMFFCRRPSALEAAFGQRTPYMPAAARGGEVEDPFSHSLQWSRRFIGLKLFMTLAEVGFPGLVERIEHQAGMGERLRERLVGAGWTIANDTKLPVVCFTRPGLDVRRLVARLHAEQIAWMSPIRISRGPLLVRACITSYRTTEADVDRTVEQLGRLAGGGAAGR